MNSKISEFASVIWLKKMTKLERRIIDITYKYKLSHLNGCLTAVKIIDDIYKIKKEKDLFVLSSGHVALALYCVLERRYGLNAERLQKKHGTHPNRCLNDKICLSTGSLGQGLTVAVGMALANRKKKVYVLISDGELAEGCCWEALRIAKDQKLHNLRVYVNANGNGAYGKVDIDDLELKLDEFFHVRFKRTNLSKFPKWLQSYHGHYVILNEEKYKELIK